MAEITTAIADAGPACKKLTLTIPQEVIQERLKESLPADLVDSDNVAYKLVPKALNDVLGQQGVAWMTEKRPSKSGRGSTTWVVSI